MKKIALTAMLAFAFAPGAARADSQYAKGSCNIGENRVVMTHVNGDQPWRNGWKAELGNGIVASVTFRPGYGMTFVTLGLTENGKQLASSTMWIAGSINADSQASDTPELSMERFNALSLSTQSRLGMIRCGYNFYTERSGG